MSSNVEVKHPKGLYLLFFVELWERFSYYGMRALLMLYIIHGLFAEVNNITATKIAGNIYGWYTGLVYLTPLLGGYLADRYLGQRKCISIGAVLKIVGLFALAMSDIFSTRSNNLLLFAVGLLMMTFGNGFLKSNISIIVGSLYDEKNKEKRDAGFTIFYMGINIGGLLAPIICGTLAQLYGFRYGFLTASAGMLIGYIMYKLLEKPLLGEHGLKPYTKLLQEKKTQVVQKLTSQEKGQIVILTILMFFTAVFWMGQEQAGASLTLFAENETRRAMTLFGKMFVMPSQYFQSINPIVIISCAPIASFIWSFLGSKGKEPSSITKFNIGLFLNTIGFFIMFLASKEAERGLVSPLWLIGFYFVTTLGELCLSPVGLSLVSKLSPIRFASIMMGFWFLGPFLGNLSAGLMSSHYASISHDSFYLLIAIISLITFLILSLITPILNNVIRSNNVK